VTTGHKEAPAARRFDLDWRDRLITGPMQTPRRFLDYTVGGEGLLDERLRRDLVSCLGWFEPEEDEAAAQRLLLDATPDIEDRVAIYVCAECGDVYRGALTAIIERRGDEIVWRDLADSTFDWDADRWDHEPLAHGELRFHASEYQTVIRNRPRA
jgi:hypothetical protein